MKELLVPVGNLDILKVAVLNGADAVYLAGKKFGARAFAGNFSLEELEEACKFCHLYGVKIYVAVNTLIYESEIDDVLEYVHKLNNMNVDALIVQDIGLISAIHKLFPDLDIHASTQVHTTNVETVKYLESLGVKRVVFARELSCDEIKKMKIKAEKEIFIHGALCVSYSGECLMSSVLLNRSGNRGECAQLCRLPYKLKRNDEEIKTGGNYLLSMKDLNTAFNFKDILESDIYSLKIEGRMKSAAYVGCATRLYRDLIDKYYHDEDLVVDEVILNDLKTIYNREFTQGFLFNEKSKNIVNASNPNHIGTHLGSVVKIDSKYIYIKLEDNIYQGDGVRFMNSLDGGIVNFLYNESKLLEKEDYKGNTILIDNKYKCHVGDEVRKTSSQIYNDKYVNNVSRFVDISVSFKARLGYIEMSFSDGHNIVKKVSEDAIVSKNRPVSKDDILSKLNKLGNSPFRIKECEILIDDNLFINMSTINKMKQELISELINERVKIVKRRVNELDDVKPKYNLEHTSLSILVRNEEQLMASISLVDRIYVTDLKLFLKYKDNEKIYYRTNRLGDTSIYDNVLITNLANMTSLKSRVVDYYLNITNHLTNNIFSNSINTLSVELSLNEVKKICEYYNFNTNFEVIVYGTLELMLMKYCLLNKFINKDDKCKVCLSNDNYYLVDRNSNHFKLIPEYSNHTMHLMNYKPIDNISNISNYLNWGIKNYRIELLDESKDEVINIISKVKKFI